MSTPTEDTEQLRLLSIFYYVWGGLTVCFSCLGGVWIAIALGAITAAAHQGGQGPPPFVAPLVGIIGVIGILFALGLGGLSLWTGKCIATQRNYTFCLVVAGLTCLSFPLGTALGVFTFIVLTRPPVKVRFNSTPLATS
jgi:hypothetical protein